MDNQLYNLWQFAVRRSQELEANALLPIANPQSPFAALQACYFGPSTNRSTSAAQPHESVTPAPPWP
jgi:hypothetical protein